MPTQAEGQTFTFETSYEPQGRLLPRRPAERSKLRLTEDELFVAFGVIGILCLFWRYTIALGVVMLGMSTFAWVMRERSRETRQRMEALRRPSGRVSIRVTEAGYSQRGDGFFVESSWGRVVNGAEIDGNLVVASLSPPVFYLPIEEMKRAGVYERVKAIIDVRIAERRAFVAKVRDGGES